MVKLQQFFQLKFSSDRLKKSKYNIDISLDDARKNSEVISVNNSELLRALFRLKKTEFNQKELNSLFFLRNKTRKLENNEENHKLLLETNEKIEKILFIEDLVSIKFTNKVHYTAILNRKGFYINGTKFVPFMASAGMIRKNTALFVNNNLKDRLMDVLENDRNTETPMAAAKFGAYFSLYSSSTLPVSFPRFAVVADTEIETLRRVDFVTYMGVDEDDNVTEKDYIIKANAFDGQGLISPSLAAQWSAELELDYTFSNAIIRAPFLKGLVTVFDFHLFSASVANTKYFTDVYGDTQNINDIDLIISESMFKLWNAYDNTETYINSCHKNKLGFGIAKVSPKTERSYSRTSYQFLQILNLNDVDVANLCEPTINWVRDISGGDADAMILYATGENGFEPKDFNRMDITTKAILLNPELARDRYIQSKFIKTIEKKKKESYMGSLLLNANYSFMISDPYYQAVKVFNLNIAPLLKDGEHYCEYWQNKGLETVGAIRSPIVHHSEFNILHLQNRDDTRFWYQHIHSGVIFPANGIGIDCAIHGGADNDGDLVCTINNSTMIKGKISGLSIVYESTKAEKVKVDARDDRKQVEGQLNGHNSKVGFSTNISSSLYCLLEEFPLGSPERDVILKRLKIGRVIQGEIIDSVKGLKAPPFRNHWTKYKRITDDMSPEEKEKWIFNNEILCQIRPAFFRFLYPHYMSKYNKEIKKYDIYSLGVFGKDFLEISSSPTRSDDENKIVDLYKHKSFFLDNNSVVNKISRYMRGNLGMVDKYSSTSSKAFDYRLLLDKNIKEPDIYKLAKMKEYLQHYKSFKRGMWHDTENSYANLDAFASYLKKECYINISSNDMELATYAVLTTYADEVSMVEFAWKLFPAGILGNIQSNSFRVIKIPVADPLGEIEYLWNRYSIKEFSLEEIYAN